MKKIIAVISFLWLCASPFVSISDAQTVLDRIVAIVDDDIILESEVAQGIYLLAMQMGIDPVKQPKETEKLRKATIENLINQKVLLIQAEKDTVKADEKQVDAYLQQQMQSVIQQLGGEDKVEEYFGMTLSRVRRTYREQIEENLRIAAVREKKLATVNVTRREVEQFFATHKDSIGQLKETVDISHILIEPKPGEKARKEALAKIKSIRERILNGEDFAELAKKYSDDPGSASRGGDLGFMSRGDFVREFEEAAFKLKPGEVSDIVRTEFGYHIIKLEERRGEKIHARHILVSVKPTKEDEIAAAQKIKEIYKELKNGADFNELVKKYSDDKSTKDENGHLGTFEIDQLRETAKEFIFALSGIKPGEYSDPVKTKYGFHILRLNRRESPRQLSLEKDWDRIQQMALNYKKQKEFQKYLQELKKDIYIEIKETTT